MPSFINQDGLELRFGLDIGNRGSKAGVTMGAGKRRELVLLLDLPALGANGVGFTADLNNDNVKDGFSNGNTPIPPNVRIVKATAVQLVAPAGGTSFTVGTFLKNGTAVNASGILTSPTVEGAQIGTMSGAVDSYVAPTAVGTYTAGKFKVIVEYITQ